MNTNASSSSSVDSQSDPAELLAEVKRLTLELETVSMRAESLEEENEGLQCQVAELRRQLFGKKSERFVNEAEVAENGMRQTSLFDEEELSKEAIEEIEDELAAASPEEEAPEEKTQVAGHERKKRKKGPKPIPDHLPRIEQVVDIDEKQCSHGHELVKTGERVVEVLDRQPAQMRVIRYIYPIYSAEGCSCADCTKPQSAEPPPRPIDESRASSGLLAQVAVSKYGDHLPLYRQSQIFAREGVHLSRSTLCEWTMRIAHLLIPIVDEMRRQLLARSYLQADETPIRVLKAPKNKGKERARKGYLWGYGIPWAEVVFAFGLTRSKENPVAFLEGFEGIMQVDGYDTYNAVCTDGTVVRVGCMAHSRRKFHAALKTAPTMAKTVLAAIQLLYRIEKEIKGLTVEERLKIRGEKAKPILEKLEQLLHAYRGYCRPSSDMGKAITYTLNEWKYLKRYADYGEAEIDNNSIEHTMRPVALGRKNFLFAGSPEGGKAAATLYSLITTCKRLEINPHEYLKDVLDRISIHPASRISELTPRGWRDAKAKAKDPSDSATP